MKSKTLVAAAVAGLFYTMGASAAPMMGTSAGPVIGSPQLINDSESTPSIGTINSLDARNGGYKGWGPMANPQGPTSANESDQLSGVKEQQQNQQQLAEVRQARDQVWVANAPLRAEYDNIGATRGTAGGFGRFFRRDSK